MGKRSLGCTLPFLLFAALCSEAAVLQKNFTVSSQAMSWTDARAYCRQNHIDLVTWDSVDAQLLAETLADTGVSPVWIGLQRDPTNDSVWKWVDFESGVGLTGDDLSGSGDWLSGQQSTVCAYTLQDQLWRTDLCSRLHNACCLQGNNYFSIRGNFTWTQASQCCASNNASLVTFSYTSSMYFFYFGWIGLYRVAGDTWSWINSQSPTFSNWAPGEPSPPDCGRFDVSAAKWLSGVCSQNLFFVCFDDNLLVVNENKTWEQALDYCSNVKSPCSDPGKPCVYRYQLLSLPSPADYSYVRERMYTVSTDEVWIGLRFLGGGWWWVGGQVLDNQECPPAPNNCGAMSKSGTNTWTARDCFEKRNFICAKYKSYEI